MTGSEDHSSLLRYELNYSSKKFYFTDPSGLYNNNMTIVNDFHHEWCLYYECSLGMLWWSIVLFEEMLQHQIKRGILSPPKSWLTYWFALLKILRCSISSTVISNLRQNHFNQILTLSLLIHCSFSLSFLSALFSFPFYVFWFHTNTSMIWWEVIIAINLLNLNGCFIWGLLTIVYKTPLESSQWWSVRALLTTLELSFTIVKFL